MTIPAWWAITSTSRVPRASAMPKPTRPSATSAPSGTSTAARRSPVPGSGVCSGRSPAVCCGPGAAPQHAQVAHHIDDTDLPARIWSSSNAGPRRIHADHGYAHIGCDLAQEPSGFGIDGQRCAECLGQAQGDRVVGVRVSGESYCDGAHPCRSMPWVALPRSVS